MTSPATTECSRSSIAVRRVWVPQYAGTGTQSGVTVRFDRHRAKLSEARQSVEMILACHTRHQRSPIGEKHRPVTNTAPFSSEWPAVILIAGPQGGEYGASRLRSDPT